ncbi:MAG: choline dehydrogenase [Proteobacteria bacterium]|nr:choline dehydrogenase [Pseudomonadota bacterium]
MTYDYIVVGAGSAGCAVAARLAEDPGARVLVLEAGGADEGQDIHVPALLGNLFRTDFDWDYETTPQTHCDGRQDYVPRGKMLGGTSSMNAMIYQRGAPANYDAWAAAGNETWGWAGVLPFFLKAENQERGGSRYHGTGGPLNVADLRDPNPLSLAFVGAAAEQGYLLNEDFNDGEQEGFGLYQVTQIGGKRCSTAVAYLHPAMKRDNLTVETSAHAQRLVIDGRRCTGVVYKQNGTEKAADAAREVIVSSGAIGSPQLLMLSGIGPKDQLEKLGIAVVLDLPGVGENLQEHLQAPVAYSCTQPITLAAAEEPDQYEKLKSEGMGMLTSNIGEAGGFLTVKSDAPAPDLQFHFTPCYFISHGDGNPEGHGFTVMPGMVGTRSVGRLTLRSADPTDKPLIDPNYFADEADLEVLVEGVKIARKLLNSTVFDAYRGDEVVPGAAVRSDDEIKAYLREKVQCIYHPVGTCKMGNDPMAVVDDTLRVIGIAGLRVADASIMPTIVNANTNAPAIMIGEKCADMISGT